MAFPMTDNHIKIVTENRKARHDYFIDDEFEAGMVLVGSEVKSLRQGQANLKDAYARVKKNELFIHQMHISPYSFAHQENHDPLRPRKLLLHKKELKRLFGKIKERGLALIPLKVYFKNGKAKITIALARGKRKYDKREALKKQEMKREMDRGRKNH